MTVPFDLHETDRLLTTTRAVRRRLDFDRPVGKDVILDCIRLSQQAPTASNTQKWRWMVVMDEGKRRAIGDFQLALRSRGLGSTLTTLSLFFEADIARLLNIPDDVMQVALLPVAYTKGTDFKLAVRPPPEEITCFDEWS